MNYYKDGSDYVEGYNPIISDTRIPDRYNPDNDDVLSYCTQNNGDCYSYSLTNYGRDCYNNPIISDD